MSGQEEEPGKHAYKGVCICGRIFQERHAFEEHLEWEHPDRFDQPDLTITCPFCGRIFQVRRLYREHLQMDHPVQDHDLQTTRWHNGVFVRCEPYTGPKDPRLQRRGIPGRLLRERRTPRGSHGLERLVRLEGEPDNWTATIVPSESPDPLRSRDDRQEHTPVLVICRCGWKGMSPSGERGAWHELRVHFRNDYRLECPFCPWRWEDQVRDETERVMAQHIGTAHPDKFPWDYS